jgi:hypothetical protein
LKADDLIDTRKIAREEIGKLAIQLNSERGVLLTRFIELAQISRAQVYKLADAGELEIKKFNGRTFVEPRSAAKQFGLEHLIDNAA